MLPLHHLVYSEKPQATQEGFRNWGVNAQSESFAVLVQEYVVACVTGTSLSMKCSCIFLGVVPVQFGKTHICLLQFKETTETIVIGTSYQGSVPSYS